MSAIVRIVCAFALAWPGVALAQTLPAVPAETSAPAETEPRLDVEKLTLPLVLIKGFPFLEGSINGRSGKLMFDTGAQNGFAVNSNAVAVPDAVEIGSGYFGSGQQYKVYRYPVVDTLTLPGGLQFSNLRNIHANPGPTD